MNLTNLSKFFTVDSAPKVFCIGFNKTGTTSLHEFFVAAGLASEHNTVWPFYSDTEDGDIESFYRRSQCYSDGELANFIRLDETYPSAIFCLNTRDERAWLRSRIKHVLRLGMPSSARAVDQEPRYGLMAKFFFTDEAAAITSWILERRIYEARVRRYFDANPRFIELSVTDDPDWKESLRAHLAGHGVIDPNYEPTETIHANSRSKEAVPAQQELTQYLALADRILAKMQDNKETEPAV